MARLTIEKQPCTRSMDTVKVTGLTDQELSELKSMEHFDSRDALITLLDSRNDGIGTMWMRGYGIYEHWFDNDTAYLNIGRSCD